MIRKAIDRASDTKALQIGKGAIAKTAAMFNDLFPLQSAIIIADTNTWRAAGEKVFSVLIEYGIDVESPFILSDQELYAEWSYLEQIHDRLSKTDAIAIAVGSGVINDLTKLASHMLGRRYMIVGTAASMDGYTAFGASITKDGNKQTFSCRAPYGMIIEPEVCAAAPSEMSAAGYADLIAKIPAAADWMIADSLGYEKIDEFAFDLVQKDLRDYLSDPTGVHNGAVNPTGRLAEGLIMSGFAMQAIQSSRPASGIEHQFSHYWDMDGLCYQGKHVSHGFKVGIGTLISTACYEFMLSYDMGKIDIAKCVESWKDWSQMEEDIRRAFDGRPGHLARGLEESKAKHINKDQLRQELETLRKEWPVLKERIRKQIYSFDHVLDCLKKVGAPYRPEMIGLTNQDLKTAFRAMPFMRSRYTIIDLLFRCGLMDEAENFLFGKGGYWEVI